MGSYTFFSLRIPIAFAKIYFSHMVLIWQKTFVFFSHRCDIRENIVRNQELINLGNLAVFGGVLTVKTHSIFNLRTF